MIQAADSGDKVKRGPSRTEYQVTSKGQAEFESLLEQALTSNDFLSLAVGIAFMEMLPRQKVMTLLRERIATLKQIAAFLKTLPTEALPSDPSKHPELIGLWISYIENQAATTQKIVEHLQAGKYLFKDENAKERAND